MTLIAILVNDFKVPAGDLSDVDLAACSPASLECPDLRAPGAFPYSADADSAFQHGQTVGKVPDKDVEGLGDDLPVNARVEHLAGEIDAHVFYEGIRSAIAGVGGGFVEPLGSATAALGGYLFPYDNNLAHAALPV